MNMEIRRIQDSIGQLENVIRGTNCFQGTDTVAKVREEIRKELETLYKRIDELNKLRGA